MDSNSEFIRSIQNSERNKGRGKAEFSLSKLTAIMWSFSPQQFEFRHKNKVDASYYSFCSFHFKSWVFFLIEP